MKQKLMESVLREEQEEEGVEEPWYIKVDDEADSSVPVFRPQGYFGRVVYFVSSHSIALKITHSCLISEHPKGISVLSFYGAPSLSENENNTILLLSKNENNTILPLCRVADPGNPPYNVPKPVVRTRGEE